MKKTYTTPKKTKQYNNDAVKLAVLKFYKIGSNQSVEQLHKAILHKMSGAGAVMANNIDRMYCGKSGLTYVKT